MPKKIRVVVSTAVGDFPLAVDEGHIGKYVFDKVTRCLGLREVWYFGLSCERANGASSWLDLSRKITEQDIKRNPSVHLTLGFKYYPENVSDVIQALTKRFLFWQITKNVDAGFLYVPQEINVMMLSYAAQARYGNYDPDLHPILYLTNEGFINPSLHERYAEPADKIEHLIVTCWSMRAGLTRIEAMGNYLSLAQDLDTYSLRQFPVTNTNGDEFLYAVDYSGLRIYKPDMILSPYTAFAMGELKNVSFAGKKVTVDLFTAHEQELVFEAPDVTSAKTIFMRTSGYFDLYRRNRQRDQLLTADILDVERDNKVMFTTSPITMSKKKMALEEKAFRDHVTRIMAQYDKELGVYQKELAHARGDTKRAQLHASNKQRILSKASVKVLRAEKEIAYYDHQLPVHRATAAQVGRRYRRISKHESGYRSEADHKALEADLANALVDEYIKEETRIATSVQAFTVPLEHLVHEGGISENDESRMGTTELSLGNADFDSPWKRRIPIWLLDEDTTQELDELTTDMANLTTRDCWLDDLYVKARAHGKHKYQILCNIMDIPITERVRKYEFINNY